MKKTSTWAGILGSIGYSFVLAIILFFGYLILVMSVPGTGDAEGWSRSANYIISVALVYSSVSTTLLFGFSFAGKFLKGFAYGIPMGVVAATASIYFSSPLFRVV